MADSQKFVGLSNPTRLIFYHKNLVVYNYNNDYNLKNADANISLSCEYVQSLLCFVTPTGNKIKLWNALTGKTKKIFQNISKNEITAFYLHRSC